MSSVMVNVTGNGSAYVDNPYPNPGETVTLYAHPNAPDTLDDITAMDEWGYSIALATVEVQSFTYQAAYGDIVYISVIFTGVTPPEPPFAQKYIWLLAKAAQRWRM